MFRKFFLVGFLIAISFFVLNITADAQVGLSPLVLALKADRGQALGSISVNNNTDTAFRARVYTAPFTYDRDKGFQPLDKIPNDLAPYLQFSPRELVVPATTNRRIRIIVRFPPSLPDGEYRTALFTENLEKVTSTNNNGFTIGVSTRVATTLYVRKGNVTPVLSVVQAKVDSQTNQIFLLLRNTGLATGHPSVTWSLKQENTTIQSGELGAATLLASSERNLALTKPLSEKNSSVSKNDLPTVAKLAPGKYQLIGSLNWELDESKQTTPFSVDLTVVSAANNSSASPK